MAIDPELFVHLEWLGYVQPVGLVVSPPALVAAQCFPDRNVIAEQARFRECLTEAPLPGHDDPVLHLADFPRFTREVLGWKPEDLVGTAEGGPLPVSLEVVLPEYHETLRPTYAVREDADNPQDERPWMMLITVLPPGTSLDDELKTDDQRWSASPQARFERLLRETRVPIGLLVNGTQIRLVYAPRGETSGYATFNVADMTQVGGRPIFAALRMLLGDERLFSLGAKRRLPAILADSRKYQNQVSTKLAEQVLAALYELLRGFQAADDQRHGTLLREVLADDPNQVYGGLLRVLLRLVFLLYAEDRSLLSTDEAYQKYYSVTGLFERLRKDAGRHTDTMDHRFGAWAQLLTLFRLVYDGGRHGSLVMHARKGYLFDPDRFPFLEGRTARSTYKVMRHDDETDREVQEIPPIDPPRVSDGVVFRVLQNLLILDGERLSYRTLDVEQIGSVYETMMGFSLEVARGRSIAIKPAKRQGAPTTINLEELLAVKPADRGKWLKERTDQSLTGQAATALKDAKTPEDAVAALDRKVAREATPNIMPPGAMVLQPSDERRRSGSHYTPRSLTEPVVRTTLRPILERLGPNPTPDQILDLKVCDPAMGSGAFLVEACRQLAEWLVKAWHAHNQVPIIPPDEDEILHARRLVAQRCLYGVDRNPMAVDLAKLSLWLATLARDHPFTFLDHALRFGDSLVGLSRKQIESFHWKLAPQLDFARKIVETRMQRAREERAAIGKAWNQNPVKLAERLQNVDAILDLPKKYGDLIVAAFFSQDNDKKRQKERDAVATEVAEQLTDLSPERSRRLKDLRANLRGDDPKIPVRYPVVPFHWEIEFPEVFDRPNPGFDAVVENPPFLGGTLIGGRLGLAYHDYLVDFYDPATGLADLVAFFIRKAHELIRSEGSLGLIATNTVAQGDTKKTGLDPILTQGSTIFNADRRYRWPGVAAVVVSILHVAKTQTPMSASLDGFNVERISSFLLKGNVDAMPMVLKENKSRCYMGTKIWGAGFVFEEQPSNGSTSLDEMNRLLEVDPRNHQVLFDYIGGEEFNSSPTQSPSRFVIDFGCRDEAEARNWPHLFSIIESRVKPVRAANKQRNYRDNWWLHANRVEEAAPFLGKHGRMLALTSVSRHLSVAFVNRGTIAANSMVLLLLHEYSDFALIQSRVHEAWARLVGSSMKDDLRYTTPCFDTFPRPLDLQGSSLGSIGQEYYVFRAEVLVRANEGLTAVYNRFHDPDERSPDIHRLRELHAAMDRAVLDAYGWADLQPTCEFLLDYEEEDDEDESAGSRRRKKPWRYRWPDELRDEVLARLLELNRLRAEEERLTGTAGSRPKAPRKGGKKASGSGQAELF